MFLSSTSICLILLVLSASPKYALEINLPKPTTATVTNITEVITESSTTNIPITTTPIQVLNKTVTSESGNITTSKDLMLFFFFGN